MADEMISADEALEIILSTVPTLGTEQIALRDAFGRTLAEDVLADEDLPPFDNSAMDGYAVIAQDTRGAGKDAPRVLKVIAEQPAGKMTDQAVTPGTAIRIMTGASIPPGADAVVVVEDTECENGEMLVHREVVRGANLRRSGEDVRRDQLVLRDGTRIGPAEMGMLAALGRSGVAVYRQPRVAVITTGDELVDVSLRPAPGQIRDSNQYSILGQVLHAGARVCLIQRVTDARGEMECVLASAAETADVVVTSGGVSVGDYDFVKEILERLGEIRFWKVAIKPGKPFAYGRMRGKPLFGLPGNPVSSMVTFDLFVRPALMRMAGMLSVANTAVLGKISQPAKHKVGRREFVRAVAVWRDGGYVATPTHSQGSGQISSMLGANSYVVIPEETGDIRSGDVVEIMLFD